MGAISFGHTSAPVGSPPAPHPGVPGKNPREAHGTCSPGAAGPGIPFQCFQQKSFLQETSVFCTSTRGQPVTELPESLLATCALLLHTLSPLCDHGQGRKGLLECSVTAAHEELLPARINHPFPQGGPHLAVLVYRLLGDWLTAALVVGVDSYSARTGSEPNCNAPNCRFSPEISAEPGISTASAGICKAGKTEMLSHSPGSAQKMTPAPPVPPHSGGSHPPNYSVQPRKATDLHHPLLQPPKEPTPTPGRPRAASPSAARREFAGALTTQRLLPTIAPHLGC